MRDYTNGVCKLSVFYKPKKQLGSTKILIHLHQPSEELCNSLTSIFLRIGLEPKMSKIDLAWDFYASNTRLFREDFLASHLFLKIGKTPAFAFKNTFYTNNLRNSVKGIRVYPKEIDGQWVTRLELSLSRAGLRRLKIGFPPDLTGLDYSRFFEFRKVDPKKLYKYALWLNRRKINRAIRLNKLGTLRIIKSHIDSWVREAVFGKSLMDASDYLKKAGRIPSHHRFLVPLERANEVIQTAAEGLRRAG